MSYESATACLTEYEMLTMVLLLIMSCICQGELKPLSCTGGHFEPIKLPLVTLIDTLDTLVIMGEYADFKRAVEMIVEHFENFALDVNVSVFETTIRLLGGLLSGHLFAIDPSLKIYVSTMCNRNSR
jgi:hypothetical protein